MEVSQSATPSRREWRWWEEEAEDGEGDPKKKSTMKLSKRERQLENL